MTGFNNRNDKVADEWEGLKRHKRITERNEKTDKRKEDNHRNFISGKLATKILPGVSSIPVYKGKDSAVKNAASFRPLEIFFTELAANDEVVARLEELISTRKP